MALVVESTSTVTTNNADNLTLTAPTGITTGDLLVIVAGGFATDAITSTGFTESISVPLTIGGDVLERQSYLTLLYKVAVLADETEANYTIAKAGTQTLGNACMMRVSGWSSGDPVFDFASAAAATDISGGGSLGQSGLTVERAASQLLIQAQLLQNTDGGTSIFSWTGYSITSSDTNPTWTEVIDAGAQVNDTVDVGTNHLAVAYAITTDTSEITAYSATLTEGTGDNNVGYGRFLVSIVEPLNATADISHLAITPTVESVTGSNTATATIDHIALEPTVESLTAASSSDGTQWTEPTRQTADWTNKQK